MAEEAGRMQEGIVTATTTTTQMPEGRYAADRGLHPTTET